MPLFGKSASEIDERRAVKRRFVELCVACAKIAPLAMTGNGVLSGSQTGNVTVAAGEFFTSLSEPEKVALRSAKGCDKPPDEAKQKEYLTLADFLKIPTLSVDGAGCMAAFVHDLIAWGHQAIFPS